MWWNKKYKDRILELEKENKRLEQSVTIFSCKNDELSQKLKGSMADLMRDSLGMQIDFSAASTDKCLPPHFLEDLSEDERKNFIIDMETIRSNDRFQKVIRYMINLFATNAIYKYDEEQRKNGQIAVVAFRTFLKQFDDMHRDFISYKKVEDDFDPLATLPE